MNPGAEAEVFPRIVRVGLDRGLVEGVAAYWRQHGYKVRLVERGLSVFLATARFHIVVLVGRQKGA